MAGRTLTIDIKTQDAQTLAALKRVQREVNDTGKSMDRAKGRGMSLGGALGGLAVGAGLGLAVSEFEEAEKAMAATEAVIKSTGNAAEVSADQQAKLVAELSRLAGVDDDVINGGANMLRTFTSIKGENFGLALASSLDIAAMKGQDFATVSEQVGKALNDPVAGMGKLAKQGVVLSEVQKQQVRDFAAVGDTASAQKVILKELETEYGGQAEAAATSSGKMKVAFGEAAESVGAVLAPAMQVGADAIGALAGGFGSLPPITQTAVIALGLGGFAAKKMEGYVNDLDGGIGNLGQSLSGVDKGLIAATAGLTAFTATTAALDAVSNFKGDAEDLNAELKLLGEGKGDVNDIASAIGTDIDGLAGKFRQASDAPKDWKDALGEVFSKGTEVLDTRQAQESIGALDKSLADAVSSGNAEGAKKAYDQIVQALADQGLAYDEIIPLLPEYADAVDRANRETGKNAGATDEATGSVRNWYGATNDQRDALIEQTSALNEANDEMQTSIDLANTLVDSSLALKSAHDAVQDAQLALADSRTNGSAEQQQRAEDDLTAAILRESEAAVKVAEDNAAASGKHLDASEKAKIQRDKLAELATQTGFTSDEIKWLSAMLDNAAKEREVKIYTAASEERAARLIAMLKEIASLSSSLTDLGSSVLSGTAGAAIQQSEAAKRAGAGTSGDSARSVGNGITVAGDVNIGTTNGLRDLRMEAKRLDGVTAKQVKAA